MPVQGDTDTQRRVLLERMLAMGLFGAGEGLVPATAAAGFFGRKPRLMAPGKSVFDLAGKVLINGRRARTSSIIRPGDTVETGPGGYMSFVVGKDAFIIRERSRLAISGSGGLVGALRLFTGALLSVFGKREHRLSTPLATIGIRGTGVYIESLPELSYVCTCYGISDLGAQADPQSRETVVSKHHNAPRYILAAGREGSRIRPAPFKNHTDMELALIEALVGRVPPFEFTLDRYGSPMRRY